VNPEIHQIHHSNKKWQPAALKVTYWCWGCQVLQGGTMWKVIIICVLSEMSSGSSQSYFRWIKNVFGAWCFPAWSLVQGVLTVRSNRGNCEWGEENGEWGGGGGGEPQNEAREEEKCFIIHSDPFFLSAASKGVRGAHQQGALITKIIQLYIQCTACWWQGPYSQPPLADELGALHQHNPSCSFELISKWVLTNSETELSM